MPTREKLLGLLVQVGDSDSGGQDGIVRVSGCHGGSCLGSKSVKLNCRHTTIHTRYHFHGDLSLLKTGEEGREVRREERREVRREGGRERGKEGGRKEGERERKE